MPILACALLSPSLPAPSSAAAQEPRDGATAPSTVLVRGEAEVSVPPDTARVQLGVVAQASDAAEAQSQVSEAAQRVLDALAEAGIPDRDVRTTGLHLYPVYDQRPRPVEGHHEQGPEIVGYRASNSVSVTIRDLEEVGTVLDRAVTVGATNVDSLELTVIDESKARQQALENAVADAHARASAIAKALGRSLGEVVEVQEDGASVTPMFREVASPMMRAQAAAAPPVAGGTVTVHAQVTVRYRLGG